MYRLVLSNLNLIFFQSKIWNEETAFYVPDLEQFFFSKKPQMKNFYSDLLKLTGRWNNLLIAEILLLEIHQIQLNLTNFLATKERILFHTSDLSK